MILSMLNIPIVKINNIIYIGKGSSSSLRAVVCNINPDNKILGYDLEAVYQQGGYKLVRAEVIWDRGVWQFKDPNGMGISLNDSESHEFKEILKKYD